LDFGKLINFCSFGTKILDSIIYKTKNNETSPDFQNVNFVIKLAIGRERLKSIALFSLNNIEHYTQKVFS